MSTRSTRALAVIAASALLVITGAAVSQAGHDTAATTNLTGCLTPGGDFKNLALGDVPSKPCSSNDTLVHLSSGDITNVQAGTGLTGGATSGAATLSLDGGYSLPQDCDAGEVAKQNGTAWQCAADNDTTYAAGTGLDRGSTDYAIEPGYRLPQGCSSNQVAKSTGGSWVCAADNNTTYSGANFATSNQSCSSGQYASGVNGSGGLTCAPLPAGNEVHAWTEEAGRAFNTNIELSPIAENQTCCNFPVTTLLDVSVPAGTYVVTASLELSNDNAWFGQNNTRDVGCGINTTFFNSHILDDMPGDGRNTSVSTQKVVTLTSGGTIALQCAMLNGATDRSYVYAGTRSLSALRLTAHN